MRMPAHRQLSHCTVLGFADSVIAGTVCTSDAYVKPGESCSSKCNLQLLQIQAPIMVQHFYSLLLICERCAAYATIIIPIVPRRMKT